MPLRILVVDDHPVVRRGHQDLGTTLRYMHLSPAAIEGAIQLLDQPAPTRRFGDILETEGSETAKRAGRTT